MHEAYEEAGVVKPNASGHQYFERDDLTPVCFVIRSNNPRRGDDGEPKMILRKGVWVQERGIIPQHIFAHCGKVPLRETTDKDAKDPKWSTLPEIIEGTRKGVPFHNDLRKLHKDEKEAIAALREQLIQTDSWSLSHVAVLVQALYYIGRRFIEYEAGHVTDPRERRLYDALKEAALISYKNHNLVVEDWCRGNIVGGVLLEPLLVLTDIVGANLATRLMRNITFEPVNAKTYFVSRG